MQTIISGIQTIISWMQTNIFIVIHEVDYIWLQLLRRNCCFHDIFPFFFFFFFFFHWYFMGDSYDAIIASEHGVHLNNVSCYFILALQICFKTFWRRDKSQRQFIGM